MGDTDTTNRRRTSLTTSGTPATPATPATSPTPATGAVWVIGAGEVAERARSGHGAAVRRLPRLPTGFPSPAEDMAEAPLDLNDLLAPRPSATFFVELAGDALLDAGMYSGDILVVDRSLYATYGALVVVALDGALVARYYCPDSSAIHLLPAHPDVAPISIRAEDRQRCQIWGVVTATIHRLHTQT